MQSGNITGYTHCNSGLQPSNVGDRACSTLPRQPSKGCGRRPASSQASVCATWKGREAEFMQVEIDPELGLVWVGIHHPAQIEASARPAVYAPCV